MSSSGDAPLLLSVTLRLMRLIRIAFMTTIEGMPVSPSQYRMLARLRQGPAMVTALAEWQAVTPPTATKVIDGMVERGWVERLRSDGDRRQVLVSLTAEGHEAVRRLEGAASEALAAVLDGLSREDSARVHQALAALAAALPCEPTGVTDGIQGENA